MNARALVVIATLFGIASCAGDEPATIAPCTAGERSSRDMPNDPCPQTNTECSDAGRVASALCGADGVWGTCECNPVEVQGMVCGNGVPEGTEECDGADLAGGTCAELVTGSTGTLLCTPGTCSYDTSLCTTGVGVAGSGGGAGG